MRRAGLCAAVTLAVVLPHRARAEEPIYPRLTISINPLVMLVPVYEVQGELALDSRWSVALRGGAGSFDAGVAEPSTILDFGATAVRYVWGTPRRGLQLGLDARFVSFEGDGQFLGLGDGGAIGGVAGYKRVYGPGFTLAAQLGAHVVVAGDSAGPVLPYIAVSLGWSFLPNRADVTAPRASVTEPGPLVDPLDTHRGLLVGFSVGGGPAFIEGCDDCTTQPGIAVDASLGWFLGRRVALLVDSTATVALFSLSSGFGGFGFGLTSLAVQVWPSRSIWVKVGVGAAQLSSTALGGTGYGLETGGGGTLAVGYEFHHTRHFAMDLQLRATHGSFAPDNRRLDGVNAVVGLLGFRWL